MKKQETVFSERVAKNLNELSNCWYVKIQQRAKRGIPDYLLCLNGKFIALELKKSRLAPVAPLQQWVLEKVALSGGSAFLVYPENWKEVLAYLSEMSAQQEIPDTVVREH